MAAAAQTTIIKRVEDDGHDGHHGGAWKVAYADFMTAMMAFFLLLWILSSADEQKLRGIAEYFTDATEPGGLGVLDGASLGPPGTLSASNGAILARGSEIGEQDQSVTAKWEVRDVTPQVEPNVQNTGAAEGEGEFLASGGAPQMFEAEASRGETGLLAGAGMAPEDKDSSDTMFAKATNGDGTGGSSDADHTADQARFSQLQADLMQAMQDNPDLRPLKENVVFEETEKGLRIQVIDQEGKPMFKSGSAEMPDATRQLMAELGESLSQLPNQMVITGHTDAVPFTSRANYDNWDLSTDRANAMRRVLVGSGVDRQRLLSVTGKAYTDPLVPENPEDPSNRRITVFLQYADEPAPMEKEAQLSAEQPQQPASVPQPQPASLPVESDVTILDQRTMESLRSVLR